jgi:RNA recognition motif-containing protein
MRRRRAGRPRHDRSRDAVDTIRAARNEQSRKKEAIQTKLFVGNLNFDTTPEELRALFAEIGEVVSVSVPTDRDTGRPRGFAFVELSTPEQAAAATEKLNGHELGGRALRVNEATERSPGGPSFRPGGFGAGGPGGFRPRPKGSRRNVRARKRGFG